MTVQDCPFCPPPDARVFYRESAVVGLWDGFPVSPGHALLIPEPHIASWFDATPDEQTAIALAIDDVRRAISRERTPDGFNIGMNLGEARVKPFPIAIST